MITIHLTKQSGSSPIERLAREWRVFRRVRPLKIGIREDLLLRGAPVKATIMALEAFTTTREYYLACRAGALRYDMHGLKCGAVSKAEQAYADEMLGVLDRIDACR